MKVRDMMSRPVITEDEDVSVTIVSEDMELSGIGSVVITKEDKPTGIITDRDRAIKICATKRRASEVKAKEMMSSPLITIKPGVSVEEADEVLAENNIRRLPAMENDKLVDREKPESDEAELERLKKHRRNYENIYGHLEKLTNNH